MCMYPYVEGPTFILNSLQFMPDTLSRAHADEHLKRAANQRLVRAVQLRNRADRATRRAREALAAAAITR